MHRMRMRTRIGIRRSKRCNSYSSSESNDGDDNLIKAPPQSPIDENKRDTIVTEHFLTHIPKKLFFSKLDIPKLDIPKLDIPKLDIPKIAQQKSNNKDYICEKYNECREKEKEKEKEKEIDISGDCWKILDSDEK